MHDPIQQKMTMLEKRIADPGLSKKDRRLLQNQKSALKLKLKNKDVLTGCQGKLDRMMQENTSLKEHAATLKALLQCR